MGKSNDYSGMLEIISGRRTGLLAWLVRCGLSAVTPLYRLGVGWRNRKFNRGQGVHKVEIPVISVGNLTTGGTGKTPFVIWLASFIRSIQDDSPYGKRVAILSRGYGALPGKLNDEAIEMEQRLQDVPHLQDPNRVQIARTAIDELETEIILLDDGFQHRALHRDLDIVLIDAKLPFGFGRLLPRGLLREPVTSLKRADAVVLTRGNQVSAGRRSEIKNQILQSNPDVLWAEAIAEPEKFSQASGSSRNLSELHDQPVVSVCGIGNPDGFHATLAELGLDVRESITMGDHHHYARADIELIQKTAEKHNAKAVICTHKDLVKINVDQVDSVPLYALDINFQLKSGGTALERRIQRLIKGS